MSKTWLDEVEARLVGLGLPWTAEKDGSSHRGAVRDAGGEVVAVTYCTAYDDVHGAGMATVIAAMPADLRRLLRVARAAEAARERIGDVALADGVFAEHGSGPEGQRVLAEVWRALDALDDAMAGEEST